jgi:hypothetical protein
MDRLQLAQDRYQQLARLLLRPLDTAVSDQFEAWLRDFVCPLVDQLRTNRQFQRLARWSPDHLAARAGTSQRRLLERVDRELVTCARRTDEAASHEWSMGNNALASGRPSRKRASREGRASDAQPTGPTPSAAWLATRPWFDLICPQEYFQPYRGLHLLEPDALHSTEFWRRHQQLDVPLGDYICRAGFARLEFFVQALQAEWWLGFHAAQARGAPGYHLADGLFSAKMRLDANLSGLRQACFAGDLARQRDACAALTQVYGAYHPNPDLAWLGCPAGSARAYGPMIRRLISPPYQMATASASHPRGEAPPPQAARICSLAVIQGIAAALTEVPVLYRRPVESEELIAWACDTKRLVLIDRRPRTLFWDGKEVPGAWDRWPTRWDLLWKLAQRALRNRPVDREDVTRAGSDSRAVVNRRHHLGKSLPGTLDVLIEDVRPRGYQLKLEPNEICLLQLDSDEQLVEVGSETKPTSDMTRT